MPVPALPIAAFGLQAVQGLLGGLLGGLGQDEARRRAQQAQSVAAGDARWAAYQGPWAWPLITTVERKTKGNKTEHVTVDVAPLYLDVSPSAKNRAHAANASYQLQVPLPPVDWENPSKDLILWKWDAQIAANTDPRLRAWRPYALQAWRTPKGMPIRRAAQLGRAERWNPTKRQWERYLGRVPIAWDIDFTSRTFSEALPGGRIAQQNPRM